MTYDRAVILHGYTATPASHWFPWLADHLRDDGIETAVPALPETEAPVPAAWHTAAVEAIGEPDEGLLVVAHSLGCITALRALATHGTGWRLGGLVLVSPFESPVEPLPELDPFTAEPVDLSSVIEATDLRTVICSDNDTRVPTSLSWAVASRLQADLQTVRGAGHFRGDDGFTELPEVYVAAMAHS